jgi:predicted dehydrogenase
MGQRHCRVYAGLANVDFVGLSDACAERGRAVAEQYDVRFVERYEELLEQVDAVSVATPTDTHFAVASDCLARGVHVLVEKPLAAEVDDARELCRRARRASALLQVGHIERFNPAFLELEVVLEDLEVVSLATRRLSPFDTSNTNVDVVYDLMIHDLDIVLALLGDRVSSIQTVGRAALTSAVDYAVATLSMANGPVATLTASRVTEQKVRQVEVTALGAYVEADLLNKTISMHRRLVPEFLANHKRPLRYRQESLVERIHIPTAEPLMLELQDFVQCVREGRPPRVSAEAGLRALELAAEIRSEILRQSLDGSPPVDGLSGPRLGVELGRLAPV